MLIWYFSIIFISYGESIALDHIDYDSIIPLYIEPIKKYNDIQFSIKFANGTKDRNNQININLIYSYSIIKADDSFQYLLFNLGSPSSITEEINISFEKKDNFIIFKIIAVIMVIGCILVCFIFLILQLCKIDYCHSSYCCYDNDYGCSCCWEE